MSPLVYLGLYTSAGCTLEWEMSFFKMLLKFLGFHQSLIPFV
jgi:hypothetical protein